MADRDRLAALLDDALSAMDDEWTVREMADFLIAAGVGFPDAPCSCDVGHRSGTHPEPLTDPGDHHVGVGK